MLKPAIQMAIARSSTEASGDVNHASEATDQTASEQGNATFRAETPPKSMSAVTHA